MTTRDGAMVPAQRETIQLKNPIQTKDAIIESVTVRAPVVRDVTKHFPGLSFKDLSEMTIKYSDAWALAKECAEDVPGAVLDKASFVDATEITAAVMHFLGGGQAGSRADQLKEKIAVMGAVEESSGRS